MDEQPPLSSEKHNLTHDESSNSKSIRETESGETSAGMEGLLEKDTPDESHSQMKNSSELSTAVPAGKISQKRSCGNAEKMPEKLSYNKVVLPCWKTVSQDWLKNPKQSTSPSTSEDPSQDLWESVAKDHHKLEFLEKEGNSDEDDEVTLQNLPPFDPNHLEKKNPPVRRFASVEPPYPKREFPLKKSE